MAKKLTLNIDDRIIEEAKKYAKKKRKSISKIVQDYLKHIIKMDMAYEDKKMELTPTVKQLLGSVKMKEREEEKKIVDEKFEYLKEKYLER